MRVKVHNQVFIVVALALTSHSYAEVSRQCFTTSNFPGLKTEALWVPNATFVDLKIHHKLSRRFRLNSSADGTDSLFPARGHRLLHGGGDILTLRRRFPGWPGHTDTASISTLTIYSPKSLVAEGEITVGGADGALVFMTMGSPAFRNYCFGYATKGTIAFHVRGSSRDPLTNESFKLMLKAIGHDAAFAQISLEADLVSSGVWEDDCGRCIFDGNLAFIKTDLSAFREKDE